MTVNLITQMATKWLIYRECLQHGDSGQRDDSHSGRDSEMAQGFIILLRTACNLKHDLFISVVFHLIFLDNG